MGGCPQVLPTCSSSMPMSTLLLPAHTTRPLICKAGRQAGGTGLRPCQGSAGCACDAPRQPAHEQRVRPIRRPSPGLAPHTFMSSRSSSLLLRSSMASTPAVTSSGGREARSATLLQRQGRCGCVGMGGWASDGVEHLSCWPQQQGRMDTGSSARKPRSWERRHGGPTQPDLPMLYSRGAPHARTSAQRR